MPELPEVETIARGLDKRIAGDAIDSVWLGSKPEPLKSSAQEIVAALESKTITSVRRMGKHIVFNLASSNSSSAKDTQWIVHLGMTGSLRVFPPDLPVEKHTHAILKLSSGRELRFLDPRRFGRLSVIENFAAPGSEPLHISFEDFAKLFRKRNTPIKSALLNQKLLSGVGITTYFEAAAKAGDAVICWIS